MKKDIQCKFGLHSDKKEVHMKERYSSVTDIFQFVKCI